MMIIEIFGGYHHGFYVIDRNTIKNKIKIITKGISYINLNMYKRRIKMCGIVGYVGKDNNCQQILINGLKRLEYRGYDSSGIAYVLDGKTILKKETGKLENLKNKLNLNEKSSIGIGHTRWATHGIADSINAHPHKVGKFTIVHNGIIENYVSLKKNLLNMGYDFRSETDSEVLCCLLDSLYRYENDILEILAQMNDILEGSYAVGILCDDDLENLYVLKKNSPLIIGVGDSGNFIASDVPAILDKTDKYIVLDDKDYAKISKNTIKIYSDRKEKEYNVQKFEFDISSINKQGYDHYMLKEINEQPEVFKKTTNPYLKDGLDSLLENMPDFCKYNKIRIVACGSATHAGLVGKQMLEKYAKVKTEVDTASEFRYNELFLDKDELVIVVSQSGETADTLEALKIAKSNGNDTLGIINEKGSTIAREAHIVLYTEAGKEIAVATTKAYSAQVAMLSLIALNIAAYKNLVNNKELIEILSDIKFLPTYMEELLNNREQYKEIAKSIIEANDIFFIGRGVDYALAMEGSLKLKEISYVHSEAYAAGELKHGTISLVEEGTPVFAIVTDEKIATKTISNIKEVKARGANVIYITNRNSEDDQSFYDKEIIIPKVNPLLSPLLTVIPLQLISYELANLKKCNIDKPRNLAKSVTVE